MLCYTRGIRRTMGIIEKICNLFNPLKSGFWYDVKNNEIKNLLNIKGLKKLNHHNKNSVISHSIPY